MSELTKRLRAFPPKEIESDHTEVLNAFHQLKIDVGRKSVEDINYAIFLCLASQHKVSDATNEFIERFPLLLNEYVGVFSEDLIYLFSISLVHLPEEFVNEFYFPLGNLYLEFALGINKTNTETCIYFNIHCFEAGCALAEKKLEPFIDELILEGLDKFISETLRIFRHIDNKKVFENNPKYSKGISDYYKKYNTNIKKYDEGNQSLAQAFADLFGDD